MPASVDITNMKCICGACCCSYCGMDCNPVTCMGCAQMGGCLCLKSECCFKSPCKPFLKCTCCHWCCFCYQCDCAMKNLTCCQQTQQCFCLGGGCAIPCTKDVPMMLAMMGLMCYPKCGCCINPHSGKVAPEPTPEGCAEMDEVQGSPESMEMER